MDKELLLKVSHLVKTKHMSERLEKFVESALGDGAISESEAAKIMHPLRHCIQDILAKMHDIDEGIMDVSPTHHHGRGRETYDGVLPSQPKDRPEAARPELQDADPTLPSPLAGVVEPL